MGGSGGKTTYRRCPARHSGRDDHIRRSGRVNSLLLSEAMNSRWRESKCNMMTTLNDHVLNAKARCNMLALLAVKRSSPATNCTRDLLAIQESRHGTNGSAAATEKDEGRLI